MLECRNITVRFGGLTAVKAMDLQVRQGTIHSLIGPNGAGKTTLFNAIMRLVTAQEGDIRLDGHSIIREKTENLVGRGMVRTFQNLQLSPLQTVRDNIMAGLVHGWKGGTWSALAGAHKRFMEEAEDAARSAAELFGIQNRLGSLVAGLPYGLLKKVELARAMAGKPSILLLDEPAAGLNNDETAELDEILSSLKARGLTIVLVEHDMSLVMRISDAVTVMNFGQKIADGRPEEVAADPNVIKVYLGGDYGAADR